MNKILKGTSIICLSIWISSLAVCAEEIDQNVTLLTDESGDFQYSINQDGTAKIQDYLGSDEGVVIPQLLDGIAVTSIGDYVFYDSYILGDITIPEGVTSIGEYAFANCYGTDTIEIPASVSFIGMGAFSGGRLSQINVADDNKYYMQEDGVLFEKAGKKLITYPAGRETSMYVIPDGTKAIEDMAFLYCSLTDIKIPASVEQIGDMIFKGCSGLTNIDVSADNDYYAQEDGVLFKKTEKELIAYPSGRELASYSIPDGIEAIGDFAFLNCYELVNIRIPDSLISIGDSAFAGCAALSYVEIPGSVTSIGKNAFDDCSGLTGISVSADNSYYAQIDGVLFEKANKRLMRYPAAKEDESYSIPDGILAIDDNAFDGCYNLYNINIPASVNSIGNSAFAGCSNLSSMKIPAGVSSIGDSAFGWCNDLSSIQIPDGVTSIGEKAFFQCNSLGSVELPDKLVSIGNSAFQYCVSLKRIIIPASVSDIGKGAFGGCSNLTNISVFADNEYYGQIDGVLFEKASKKLIAYPAGKEETTYSIPDRIEAVGDHAFCSCYNLTSVVLPNSLNSIEDSAFSDCGYLNDITLPDSVVNIGDFAFARSGLKNLKLPGSIEYIGKNAFMDCYDLVLMVDHDTYASQWARKNRVSYTYPDVNSWLSDE